MNTKQDIKRDLEERILSKRQQIEFDRKNLSLETEFSQENRENPEVMEEAKNYDDPTESVLETDEVKALRTAENDLNELMKQLQEFNKG
ncbi:hypothetical protein [Dyadobacter sp. CY347]|uniref:hypothetical protein n=1 Tax=Dyadobacter sp. CY347 TaxID=2909336 RepID=UPI001F197699|nr:hypothetical protein [Dyadobacter sp. CY347]MCF2490953.1 hypothetical protein [Dyadobacter sp. CY347]